MLASNNLFHSIPQELPEELMQNLVSATGVRVERIVSRGHASPTGFWYDQDHSEFVLLVSGAARIIIEGESQSHSLGPGDFLDIPAHVRHRVDWTDPQQDTIWLAVHYGDAVG